MPRSTIDWSGIESLTTPPTEPPANTFALAIAEEVGRMDFIINSAREENAQLSRLLVSFAANSAPEDSYVRHMAVLEVFQRNGILDAYFELDSSLETRPVETPGGWILKIIRPQEGRRKKDEEFKVSLARKEIDTDEGKRVIERQFYHYGLVN